jgi:CheY-like chemotaxis protein
VDSTLGKGSIFKIFLPSVNHRHEAKGNAHHAPGHLRGSERLLLVEDEEMLRSMVKSVLEGYGYHVIAASHADEAYRLCTEKHEPLQLMITDVVMPGTMSGHDLADRLSNLYPELRVLYMSGYTENTIVHQGFLDPTIHFIQKPFTPVALLTKVRGVLDSEHDDT